MLNTRFQFEVELRHAGGGAAIAREAAAPEYLRPLAEDALWYAQRKGWIGQDRSGSLCEVEPVFSTRRGKPVEKLKLHVLRRANGSPISPGLPSAAPIVTREYSLAVFADVTDNLVVRSLAEKRMTSDDKYDVLVHARESLEEPEPHMNVVVKQAPLRWVEGSLGEWRERSELLGEAVHDDEATQVFILQEAFDAARDFCRAGGAREGGAMLVGRLYRQVDPEPDLFAVVEAAFEARHADQQVFSLSLSPDTFLQFERQLERRRKRLGRPEELELGFSHGHNFLPAVDSQTAEPLCPACEKRSSCALDTAFFSTVDLQFQRAFFAKRVFSIGVVFGLTPRGEDKVRVYGFSDGVLKERSLWLASAPAPD